MPELPKSSPLGTRILSHDTVEAAFMRRAGYSVWFCYDLDGSYEELPPNLLAWLQRDQRWCFGNLQHIWLLFARRIRFANRIHILNGIMGYLSSPFWFLFLLLGTIEGIRSSAIPYTMKTHAWPYSVRAGILYAYVIALLIVPKIFGTFLSSRSSEQARMFGGRAKLWLSMVIEILLSTLLAPIQMLFYTRFVLAAITGKKISWQQQDRGGSGIASWRQLISAHLGDACLIIVWAALVAWLIPNYLPWMALIFIGPLVAIPLTRLTSSTRLGKYAREHGFFLVAEETKTPIELATLETPFGQSPSQFFQTRDYASEYGLLQAILDPYLNAAHISLLHQRPKVSIRTRAFLNSLIDRLLLDGPFTLNAKEKRMLLWDADSMELAHLKLWGSPASHLHDWWQAAFRHYNESSALTIRRSVGAL